MSKHSPAAYEAEGVGIALILLAAVVVVAFWYFSGSFGTRFAVGVSNVSGGISNGLYNSNVPNFLSGPINSTLANVNTWADQFFDPAEYNTLFGSSNG